jgi:lipoate-protein ligase A
MHLLDQTLDTPAQNLAVDEALLDACLAGELPPRILRLWEVPRMMVVVGRGSRLADEVNLRACHSDAVPVLRRVSGGLSIVTGPGCLMYSVIESDASHTKGNIDAVHAHVLDTMVSGLRTAGLDVMRAGTSDLVLASPEGSLRKFSGNSLRMSRGGFLYHGTLLYDFDLPRISLYLRQPPRAPEYRKDRGHDDFVANLPIEQSTLCEAIVAAWSARENLENWPRDRVEQLVAERYSTDDWNLSR